MPSPPVLAPAAPDDSALYRGWMQMYDLAFDQAHRTFEEWKLGHPQDPLGAASNAGAYLFSELARLGVLEGEFFTDDRAFVNRSRLQPDAAARGAFAKELAAADSLADAALRKSATDTNALFVKSLALGLRADYSSLIEKQNLTALGYTKQGRAYSERLMALDGRAFDAYLGPGIENYLLSLKSAPVRMLLRWTGSNVDRQTGVDEIRKAAEHGHYLEPFAKLLLAVAALRDHNNGEARSILTKLHDRFPDNPLYVRELNRIKP